MTEGTEEVHAEATYEDYQHVKEAMGTTFVEALDACTARMAFNVLAAYDHPQGVKAYLQHSRILFEVGIIWAIANELVELTDKGRSAAEEEETFGLPGPEGNVIPLFPSEGQYL